jgi:hypothetical protein
VGSSELVDDTPYGVSYPSFMLLPLALPLTFCADGKLFSLNLVDYGTTGWDCQFRHDSGRYRFLVRRRVMSFNCTRNYCIDFMVLWAIRIDICIALLYIRSLLYHTNQLVSLIRAIKSLVVIACDCNYLSVDINKSRLHQNIMHTCIHKDILVSASCGG